MSEPTETATPEEFAGCINAARQGSAEALGRLLELCRRYLLTVAHHALGDDLHTKAGSSDLVQETFLQAQRHFGRFQGHTEAELMAWLRAILLNQAANFTRKYRATAKRAVGREVALTDVPEPPPDRTDESNQSPSAELLTQERDEALRRALEQLPDDYRQVIGWRNYDGLAFDDIGQRLGRSAEAARKLWTRALAELRRLLESNDVSG